MNYKFTIFTPCYNGAKTIHRVFESIECQSYENFEWIIVNDGSKDDSKKVIEDLMTRSLVKDRIIFLSQANQGKHTAWRNALSKATGDLWLPADCDDSFLPDTLYFLNEKANMLDILNNNFSGINVCCFDPETGQIIGTPFPKDGMISDNIELEYVYHICGEHWGCQRIDVMKQFPFPEIKGSFYNENYLWFSFAINGYKVACYNKPLRAYFYEPSSLCNNKLDRLNSQRIYMWIHYAWWQIRKAGPFIWRYSRKGYFDMWKCLVINIIKYPLSIARVK